LFFYENWGNANESTAPSYITINSTGFLINSDFSGLGTLYYLCIE
jgi:hypothetical protein